MLDEKLDFVYFQDCPEGLDYRAEQCAIYNSRTFKGKLYMWEPHLAGKDIQSLKVGLLEK